MKSITNVTLLFSVFYIGPVSAEDQDDLTQEVFIRLLNSERKFSDKSSAQAYLYRIAANVLKEHYRRNQREIALRRTLRLALGRSNYKTNPQAASDYQELADGLERAKSRLSYKQQQALNLTFYDNIPPAESAQQAGCLPVVCPYGRIALLVFSWILILP